MLALLLQLALAAPAPPRSEQAAATVREAVRAVEGDSVAQVAARWRARGADDRAAALGLATLARLTYRYEEADRRYAALHARGAGDDVARYALLGAGWGADAHGDPPRSDTLFAAARAAAHAAHDSAAEAEAMTGLCVERAALHGVSVGLALLDAAEPLARDDWLRAEIAARRSLLFAVSFDSRAQAEGRRGVELARRARDRRAEARALRSIALDYRTRGKEDSSLAVLTEVERLETAARDRSPLAETLLRHADILVDRGELGRLRPVVERAAAEARASDNAYAIGSAEVGLASLALSTREYAAARAALDEAARRYELQHDVAGRANVDDFYARLALATGDLARARTVARRARDFHHSLHDVLGEFDVLRTLAAIDRRAGDYAAARRWLDSGIVIRPGERWRRELSYDAAAIALQAGDPAAADRLLARYLAAADTTDRLTRAGAREMRAAAAARLGDLARAEEEMTAAGADLDSWRATLSDRALRVLAFQAWSRDAEIGLAPAPTVIAALAAHGRADAAFALAERRRARELADALVRAAALSPTGAPLRATRLPAATGSAVAAMLDTESALVEYVSGTDGAPTTVLVLRRGGDGRAVVRGALLPSADSLAPAIARLDALLESGDDAGALAASLGRALLDAPLALAGEGIRRLVIVPDGPLHRVPFDALRTADGRWVAERYAVSLVPSAGVALALRGRTRAAPPHPTRLLAFGDPDFGGEGALPRLPGSGDEARSVARYASESVLRLGAEASASYLRHTPLDSFDVIHFATHAVVDDASLARTALALAPAAGESGFVSAGELAGLHLDASLVVLSACRSAGGVVVDGEGVQGLTAPLLQAGARAVVATQWAVDDRATGRFVGDFYSALAHGLPTADALRAARLAAIRRGAPVAEWSAFTLVGDPLVRVPLRAPAPVPHAWWIAALGIVAVPLALRRAYRRGLGAAGRRTAAAGEVATIATGTRR